MFEEPRKSPTEPRGFHGTHFEYHSLRRAVKHILLELSFFSLKGVCYGEVKRLDHAINGGPLCTCKNHFLKIIYGWSRLDCSPTIIFLLMRRGEPLAGVLVIGGDYICTLCIICLLSGPDVTVSLSALMTLDHVQEVLYFK